mgnify:CR=1 FL=1
MPCVTVIVPNYKHAQFLELRLNSILTQTYQDYEIVILDDFSNDDSKEIIERFRNNPRVSKINYNITNSGSTFNQWAKGIQLARGKYIWIAESDDYAEPRFLEETTKVLDNDPGIVFVYTDSKRVDENNHELGLWQTSKNDFFKTDRWSHSHYADGRAEVINYLLFKTTIKNVSAVLFRRESLLEPNYLEIIRNYKNVGDLYTYINLALQGRIGYIKLTLNNYREHSNNITAVNQRSGILFRERFDCYRLAINMIFLKLTTSDEISKISDASKYILLKNVCPAIEFGFLNEVKEFLYCLKRHKVFSASLISQLFILLYVYNLKIFKISSLAKKRIKKLCKTSS